ncbi:hypothetical protein L0Y65_05865 [Candidatus Micrarchaeota archaeon]|nr:hypothetical protein [Candidatus Micrarchaeota archaeon]
MEPGDYAPALKKIKVGALEPELQREICELAAELGYEATITASSSLHFLIRLYRAEKAKDRAGADRLKKAEDMILRLSSLHFAITQREEQRRKEERKKKMPLTLIEGGLRVSDRTRKLLNSIGIESEGVIIRAEELFGERKVGERVVLTLSTTLGEEVVRKVFAAYPETILIPKEDAFLSELDAMENKKAMLDGWAQSNGRPLPAWADYNQTPGILLDTYADIARQLDIELPPEVRPTQPEKEVKYRGKPMHPDDFMKVVKTLGFAEVRHATHGTLLRDDRGNVMSVAKSHRSQAELNSPTIKKKLVEAGVDLDQFEEKRRQLKL